MKQPGEYVKLLARYNQLQAMSVRAMASSAADFWRMLSEAVIALRGGRYRNIEGIYFVHRSNGNGGPTCDQASILMGSTLPSPQAIFRRTRH